MFGKKATQMGNDLEGQNKNQKKKKIKAIVPPDGIKIGRKELTFYVIVCLIGLIVSFTSLYGSTASGLVYADFVLTFLQSVVGFAQMLYIKCFSRNIMKTWSNLVGNSINVILSLANILVDLELVLGACKSFCGANPASLIMTVIFNFANLAVCLGCMLYVFEVHSKINYENLHNGSSPSIKDNVLTNTL